jgi:uncharacterized Rmd1/YagE family protein
MGHVGHTKQRFLKEISKFELQKLASDDVETEKSNLYYTHKDQTGTRPRRAR